MTQPTILRLPAVKARTGLSRSSIYSLMALGAFPAAYALGDRAVGWRDDEIDHWIASRSHRPAKAGRVSP